MNKEHVDTEMVMIETNLDDMSGEWMGYVMERIFEKGARDAYYTPIYMKKNRPAQKLSVLARMKDLDAIKRFLFQETTTLGVRWYPVSCHRLEREFISIPMGEWGSVTVKTGKTDGELVQIAPEYEDCRTVALKWGVPLKEVYEQVKHKAAEMIPEWKRGQNS